MLISAALCWASFIRSLARPVVTRYYWQISCGGSGGSARGVSAASCLHTLMLALSSQIHTRLTTEHSRESFELGLSDDITAQNVYVYFRKSYFFLTQFPFLGRITSKVKSKSKCNFKHSCYSEKCLTLTLIPVFVYL